MREIAVADESVFGDVLDKSTAEELMMLDGQDESCVDSCDVIFGLAQMKLEEPDRKKNISINLEPQLTHSDVKNWKASFFYAESDEIFGSDRIAESAIQWPLMLGQSKISSAEVLKSSTTESDSEVLHVHKMELGDDKTLTSPRASDLELKIPIDGGNASPFDFGDM